MRNDCVDTHSETTSSNSSGSRVLMAGLWGVGELERWTLVFVGSQILAEGTNRLSLVSPSERMFANTWRRPDAVSVLGQRLRRWPNTETTSGQWLIVCNPPGQQVTSCDTWFATANVRRRPNVGLMLSHRLECRPGIKAILYLVCWG